MMHRKKTILVVEDEKSLREAIVDFLQLKNFVPLAAKNGIEGVEIALAEHPDLILMDLMMPEMDGMTALVKIREDAWGATVPVIILTNLSAADQQPLGERVAQQPVVYLIKSNWRLHDIVKKIEDMLGIPLP